MKTRARAVRLVLALACVAVVATCLPMTSASAATVTMSGTPGQVYEGTHYIHCNNNYSSPSISVEGVQTWASVAGGIQKVGASVTLFKWTNTGWTQVGFQSLGYNWTRLNYGAVSFGPASWSLGSHGYYKAEVTVQWVTQYNGFIGQSIIRPAVPADFSASYAYNGYCWA